MSEEYEAKLDGAKLQKNSGRGQLQKGDARWHGYILDYKESGKSYSLSQAQWAKVCTDAVKHRAVPLLKVVIGTGRKIRLAVLEWSELEELVDKAEKWDTHVRTQEFKDMLNED